MADAPPSPPPCVIVLGMHRSGTSLLTGSLEAAGLHLGEVNDAAPFNRRGNKENESIRDLNDTLLERSGAAWNRPPRAQVRWGRADEARGRSLVRPYLAAGRPWGFKDPRTVWTVEGWLRLLPHARLVGVFRHPSLVVQSLTARSGDLALDADDALGLWCAYKRRAAADSAHAPVSAAALRRRGCVRGGLRPAPGLVRAFARPDRRGARLLRPRAAASADTAPGPVRRGVEDPRTARRGVRAGQPVALNAPSGAATGNVDRGRRSSRVPGVAWPTAGTPEAVHSRRAGLPAGGCHPGPCPHHRCGADRGRRGGQRTQSRKSDRSRLFRSNP